MQYLNTAVAFLLAATAVVASPTPSGLECRRPPRPCNKDIVFTLSDITYESNYVYSTPAHLATSLGTIKFNLTNPAEPYVTHCMAQSTRYSGFFYGDETYKCATHAGAAPGVGANFTFSAPSGHITIDQTWSCGKTSQYLGYGAGNVTLDCKTTNYQNSNWSLGQIYSSSNTVCKPTQLQLPATVFTKKDGNNTIIAADHMGVTITDRVY